MEVVCCYVTSATVSCYYVTAPQLVFLDVVINSSHIVILIKLVEQFVECYALFLSHLLGVVGKTHELCALDLIAVLLKVLLELSVAFWFALCCDCTFFLVVVELIYTEVDKLELKFLKVNSFLRLDSEHCLAGEKEAERTRCAECTTILGEV